MLLKSSMLLCSTSHSDDVAFHDLQLADAGWSVFPGGVQEAALAVGGGRDEGVEIGLFALEQKGSVVGRIDATRNAAVAQGIAVLQEHLVGAVGGAHAVPDVLWAAGGRQFGHDVRRLFQSTP